MYTYTTVDPAPAAIVKKVRQGPLNVMKFNELSVVFVVFLFKFPGKMAAQSIESGKSCYKIVYIFYVFIYLIKHMYADKHM